MNLLLSPREVSEISTNSGDFIFPPREEAHPVLDAICPERDPFFRRAEEIYRRAEEIFRNAKYRKGVVMSQETKGGRFKMGDPDMMRAARRFHSRLTRQIARFIEFDIAEFPANYAEIVAQTIMAAEVV